MNFKNVYKLVLIAAIAGAAICITDVSSDWYMVLFRLFLLLILLIEITKLFKTLIVDSGLKEWIKGLGITTYALLAILILLEALFMFIPRSHGLGYTLAGKLWFAKYWQPINSYGFRDTEPVAGKHTVFFIGDSYTEGHGIKANERFSNIAATLLKTADPTFSAINLGLNGSDTKTEFATLKNFISKTNIKPEYIVLQYFGNDIEHTATENGVVFSGFTPYTDVNLPTKIAIKNSYLLNYFYWKFPRQDVAPYWGYLNATYNNPIIFNQHLQDIDLFINYAKMEKIKLIVAIFPFMQSPELSTPLYVDKLKTHLDSNDVEYLDITPLITPLSVEQRIVNINDGHASALVNEIVGKALYSHIINYKNPK